MVKQIDCKEITYIVYYSQLIHKTKMNLKSKGPIKKGIFVRSVKLYNSG